MSHVTHISGAALFLCIAVLCLTAGMAAVRRSLFPESMSLTMALASSLADAMLVFLPYVLLRPRLRWTLWIALPALALLLYANIIFFRNYNDMIPGSLYSPSIATNSFVLDSALHSLRAADLVAPVLLGAVIAAYAWLRRQVLSQYFSKRFKLIYSAVLVILLMFCTAMTYRRISSYISSESLRQTIGYYTENWQRGYILMSDIYRDFGIAGYTANVLGSMVSTTPALTDSERALIESRLRQKPSDYLPAAAGIVDNNRAKNLVLIIVESLNSSIFDLPWLDSVAPFIASCARDTSALVVRDVMTQAWFGRSSDGQFILNTGLLPLNNEALVSRYAMASYPSLAKALKGYRSEEAIGEDGSLWRHTITSESYGYHRLNDKLQGDASRLMTDSATYAESLRIIDDMSRPFFLEITTLTMHPPFEVDSAADSLRLGDCLPGTLTAADRGYLTRLAYADRALQQFIAALGARGLTENTVIAITGDHEAGKTEISTLLQTDYVPFIVLNAGVGMSVSHPAEQTDIYPTLLDIMGAGDYQWRGFGSSLLRKDYRPVTDADRNLSARIIRAGYFR